jgi:hypothetical protein
LATKGGVTFVFLPLANALAHPLSSAPAREFAASLDKPFTARYNPYTESIELLDNNSRLRDLSMSIQSDVTLLVHALSKRV